MRLHGRELRAGMVGQDVSELHQHLLRHGFRIPEHELRDGIYGVATAQAVATFQQASGLLDTAVVDADTAEALGRATDDAGEATVVLPPPSSDRPDRRESQDRTAPHDSTEPRDRPEPRADEPTVMQPPTHDRPPATAEPDYLVRGQVLYRGGLPIADLLVRAVHRDLRRETALGEGATDRGGQFEIPYRIDGLGLPAGRSADLLVRAFQRDQGALVLVAESAVIYHARKVEKVRLQVDGGPERTWSEYEQLLAEVEPLLGGVAIASLAETADDPDVSLLVGKTGQPARRVADLVLAHKLAARSDNEAPLYYGLIRSGLGTNLSEMLAQPPDVQRRALESAIESRVVPGKLINVVEEVPERLTRAAGQWMLRMDDHDGRTPFGAVLATALSNADDRADFTSRFLTHQGPVDAFWKGVRDDDRLGRHAVDIELSLKLAALTRSHLPAMRALRERAGAAGLRGLAGLSATDIEAILAALPEDERFPPGITGDTPQERLTAYAQTIAHIVADAVPTDVLAHRAIADAKLPRDTQRFWHNVIAHDSGFDLRRGDVGTFLNEHPELLDGVRDAEGVRADVATVRRLFNITQDYAEVSALRSAGLDSAAAVAHLGASTFTARMGAAFGGSARALVAYEKAATVAGTSMALYSGLSPMFQNLGTYSLSTPDLSALPNLQTLFGSLDLCDCEHCRSVLSPAAYLTELLTWLGERELPGGGTARDVLYARRPDIGEIELTCVNTNTPMPYVDLAIELLELLVAPLAAFDVADSIAGDLDARTVSAAVRQQFAAHGVTLAQDQTAFVVEAGQHWFLTDHAVLYAVRRAAPGTLSVRLGSYQTRGSAEDVAAEAEHQHTPAYDVLRSAVHPSALPLDLWWEEVRAYLDHLGVARTDLMREFAPAVSDVDADVAFAGEYLGLTTAERQVVTATGAAGTRPPWEYFGLAENANPVEVFDASSPSGTSMQSLGWLQALAWVRELLKRTDLSYQDLLELLGTRFVNPNAAIVIASADPADPASCDLAKLHLSGLTAEAASRLRRFARLRHRLGWSAQELDDAIGALAADVSDVDHRLSDALVVRLSHMARLRATLGAAVEELCAFWAPLPTRRDDALYERLFRNPSVLRPLDAGFTLNAARTELADLTQTISGHTPTIVAALGLTAAELSQIAADTLGGDTLNLANLSTLYRHSRLARGLGLSVRDYLTLRSAAGLDPFSLTDTAAVVRFADLVARVRASGLSVSDVDYLLYHGTIGPSALAPDEADIAAVLGDLRAALRAVIDDTALLPDPSGDRMARAMASLRWPAEIVQRLAAVLDGTATFSAPLTALPSDLTMPAGLADRVRQADGTLTIRVALTTVERDNLVAASADSAFHTAVVQIFTTPRSYAATYLKTVEWPSFRVPLAALPAGVVIPNDLRARVFHDEPAAELVGVGPLTESDRTRLYGLSADGGYRAAVDALHDAPAAFTPAPQTVLLTAAAVDALFDSAVADRFTAVDGPLLAYLRQKLSRQLVVRRLGEALGLSTRMAERLLTREVSVAGDPTRRSIEAFLAPAYADSHPDVELTEAHFPEPFGTYLRLHKSALLVQRLRLTATELDWLAAYGGTVPARPVPWRPGSGSTVGWLRFDDIPAGPVPKSPTALAALLRLVDLDRLRDTLGEAVVSPVLAEAYDSGAAPASLLALFADVMGADPAEIEVLAGPTVLNLTLPDALQDETGPLLLARSLRRMRTIGASAAQCRAFAAAVPTADDARAARTVVKAKYGQAEWPPIARTLRDRLRSRQREALVAHLVTRGRAFADVTALYDHLLLDCEMDPCMLTSRIKQAVGSVQLFVQRCLLNLEPGVVVDEAADGGWREWRWMKSYRVWEANRKVFCYPENWLEPELRDDKTPFFEELESALLQDDVTAEVAENAFRTYLQRLDGVARLEILGTCREAAVDGRPAVLHVFGRTHGMAPTYYHRRRVDGGRWTAWERIDVDITEPQLLPVVWNRRLYLFWPVFTEGTVPVEPPPDKPVTPAKYFDIQLAWSEYRGGRWQPKQLSSLSVRSAQKPDASPDHGRRKHVLRARATDPSLRVWYEYDNPTTTYDDSDDYYGPVTYGFATVNGWYFTGCDAQVQGYSQRIYGLFEPNGTTPVGMLFEQIGATPLHLPLGGSAAQEGIALASSPATFTLAYAQQDAYITGRQTFFYQDTAMTYHVDPGEDVGSDTMWTGSWQFSPVHVDLVNRRYYEADLAAFDTDAGVGLTAPSPLLRAALQGRGAAPALQLARTAADAGPAPAPRDPVASGLATIDRARAALVRAQTAELEARARPGAVSEVPSSQAMRNVILSRSDKRLLTIGEYVDDQRIFDARWTVPAAPTVHRYRFQTHYHPYACAFLSDLNAGGVERLVRRAAQLRSSRPFPSRYQPTDLVLAGDQQALYPIEDVDFEYDGAYAAYNWELFFHAPLMIALRLSANQRFEDAQRWFHLIFDPTDASNGPVPARFWQTRPFYEQSQPQVLAQRIDELLAQLADGSAEPALVKQVREWRTNPFQPFAIARLRIAAFQKSVVMSYLDNLIAWGDQLFRRDTIESINEATQLYVLAAELLGTRPAGLAPRAVPQVRTPISLDPDLDALSDALVEVEQLIAAPAPDSVIVPPDAPPLTLAKMLYFGVPRNDKLLGYWDTVADRLFKIRHCMSIEGVVRQLPLFEPPIDPALLVRAAAAGVDLASALADVSAPAPHYRFRVMSQRAAALCQEVKALGQQLLGALERRDAEALAQLRAGQERELTELVERVRVRQEDEALAQIASLRAARDVAVQRYLHYQRLLGVSAPRVPAEDQPVPLVDASANAGVAVAEGVRMLRHDRAELQSLSDAHDANRRSSITQSTASVFNALPTISFDGKPWGVGSGTSWGGPNLGAAASALAAYFGVGAEGRTYDAGRSSRLAQHIVRENEWVLQNNQAALDVMNIDRQRLAAEIRLDVARVELANHRTQIAHQRAGEEFLRSKFTNQQLYDWMVGQLSTVYFQAYQLAYDAAKAAERAFRRELGVADSDHIRFGYWDSLRKGLLAGEQLMHAVQRMDAAYVEQNRREYELTKHVSLAGLHPAALVELRETGRCYVQLPETIFDLDRPGDYLRRIKAVSVSVPCTVGPYASLNCSLTLLSSRVRTDTGTGPGYAWTGPDDTRFRQSAGATTTIVTSSGREDAGLFETNLNDERYLPFEGEGAISTWQLELPMPLRQFDYQTISDVVLHLRYTARGGGSALRTAAVDDLAAQLTTMEVEQGVRGLFRLLSARYEFSDAWQSFLYAQPDPAVPQAFQAVLGIDRFPMMVRDQQLRIASLAVFFRPAGSYDDSQPFSVVVRPPDGSAHPVDLRRVETELGGLPGGAVDLGSAGVPLDADTPWIIELTAIPDDLAEETDVDGQTVRRLRPQAVKDLGILVRYTF